MLGEQVLTIFSCIKQVRLNWNFIVIDVQSATYSSHGAPCPSRDLFPWLNTRVKVHISLWTIREYPKRHFRYLSDSGDTFLPLMVRIGKSWIRGMTFRSGLSFSKIFLRVQLFLFSPLTPWFIIIVILAYQLNLIILHHYWTFFTCFLNMTWHCYAVILVPLLKPKLFMQQGQR